MDSSSLPLRYRVIKEKTKRRNYTWRIWNKSTIANPPNFQPKNCDWVLKNSTFKLK